MIEVFVPGVRQRYGRPDNIGSVNGYGAPVMNRGGGNYYHTRYGNGVGFGYTWPNGDGDGEGERYEGGSHQWDLTLFSLSLA